MSERTENKGRIPPLCMQLLGQPVKTHISPPISDPCKTVFAALPTKPAEMPFLWDRNMQNFGNWNSVNILHKNVSLDASVVILVL